MLNAVDFVCVCILSGSVLFQFALELTDNDKIKVGSKKRQEFYFDGKTGKYRKK